MLRARNPERVSLAVDHGATEGQETPRAASVHVDSKHSEHFADPTDDTGGGYFEAYM